MLVLILTIIIFCPLIKALLESGFIVKLVLSFIIAFAVGLLGHGLGGLLPLAILASFGVTWYLLPKCNFDNSD